MPEPERAQEFREAVADLPSRSFKPTKRQGAAGLTSVIAVLLGLLRLATYHSHSHVDNTAYLTCIARAQSAAQDPAGLAFPEPDPSFGDPSAFSDQGGLGPSLADASIACTRYPH